jgi:hypothetical protein
MLCLGSRSLSEFVCHPLVGFTFAGSMEEAKRATDEEVRRNEEEVERLTKEVGAQPQPPPHSPAHTRTAPSPHTHPLSQ